MIPAPPPRDQVVVGDCSRPSLPYFRGQICLPLPSLIDVKLSDLDVLQPDIVVGCDPEQIRPTHIKGATRLIVEAISESTEQRDRGVKIDAYARRCLRSVAGHAVAAVCRGVRARRRRLSPGRRVHAAAVLAVGRFPGLVIALAPVFNFPLAPAEECFAAREPPSPPYAAPHENG